MTGVAHAATVQISVTSNLFTPKVATVSQGSTAEWNFEGGIHNVTDGTGMTLFASGNRGSGSFSYVFKGAGLYAYSCTLHAVNSDMRGTIKVPMKAPATAARGTAFTVTWSSTTAASGFNFDVQVKVPGSSQWADWKKDQTAKSASYTVPANGATGAYYFRAKMQKGTNNATASAYSAAKKVTVS